MSSKLPMCLYLKLLRTVSCRQKILGVLAISSRVKLCVQSSRSVVSNSLWPREPQHTRPPCPSPTPRVHPNPCPSSQWCHPTISSSVVPFSSCPQSFPASGSFPMSQPYVYFLKIYFKIFIYLFLNISLFIWLHQVTPEHIGSVVVALRFSCPATWGILVPGPGIKPTSPALQVEFLTTWPPGKSLCILLI